MQLIDDPLVVEMTINIPSPYKEADAIRFLNMAVEGRENSTAYVFAIRLSDGGTFMGGIGLHISPRFGHAELGYWLGAPYRRKGYITEAIGTMIDAGFSNTDVARIHAVPWVHNAASAKALLATGMKFEAALEDYAIKDGKAQSANLYRILRTDWDARRTQDVDK